MFKKRIENILLLSASLFCAILAGCTGLKGVSGDKHIYTGYKLIIDSSQFLSYPSETRADLKGIFTFKPNSKFLWMRPRLILNNIVREPKKEKGFRFWLKYKLGQSPSFIEDINLPNVCLAIENRLQNLGNFQAKADFKVISKNKRAKVKFFISPEKPYTLNLINYPDGSKAIAKEIKSLQTESTLKTGQTYNLKHFENERSRIDKILKDKGYYYFNPDYLLFNTDTTVGNHKVDTWLVFKKEMPDKASTAFRFENIYVMDDYSLIDYRPDTVKIDNYFYVSEKHKLHPQTILNSVFLVKDSLYSRTDQYRTIRRLMGIGVYKYANARFTPDSSLTGKMNANVLLTPVKKISMGTEVNASVRSDNYVGPGLNLTYKDRNIFGGAELLAITLAGFLNFQYSGATKGQTAYEIILDASLTLPKFLPFHVEKNTIKKLDPKTVVSAGVGIYTRINLYEMYSFNVALGYMWKPRTNIKHTFKPVVVSFTDLAKSSIEFDQYLLDNPTIAKSFEEQFIVGISYNYLNTNIHLRNKKHRFYISETVDLSGNLVSVFTTLINGSPPNSENPYKLLGLPYSQFAIVRNELRYYYTPNKKQQIATRIIAGIGLPYSNSSTIPYSRQFYVGGTNDIRAFIARSIGPGTYYPPDSLTNLNIDQTGDIKLEANLEYRFGIYKLLKGALFVDVGNVWLTNADPQRPGGKFEINTFLSQIACGTGLGFRFDFNFIILRLDMAFPLTKPYLPEGERWVGNKIAFGSSNWRRENIVWNIAIGYPF